MAGKQKKVMNMTVLYILIGVFFVLLTGLISLLLGAVAGIYPAYYMTSFQPALALKGTFGLSLAGRRLRTVLMSVQFITAYALIIASIFMALTLASSLLSYKVLPLAKAISNLAIPLLVK